MHCNSQSIILGLTRIIGFHDAERCLGVLQKKLTDFNVCLEDHATATVSDGASVMKKIGELPPVDYQLSYSHAFI